PEVKSLLAGIAQIMGFPWGEAGGENVDLLLDFLGDRNLSETLRAMTRMTVSPNVVHGGTKTNVVPDCCEAEVDVRILPGQDREYVFRELRRCAGEEVAIEITNYHPPTFSPAGSVYYRLIEETTKEAAGRGAVCLPYISPGATDSRFLREAGIPAYGINHMAEGFDPEIKTTVHGRNERIDVKSLHVKAEFLVALAKKYLG
ncbi:MAG: M20/M25/M40 family metallo-hydrolase, partial [Desulfotomaculales bacterium]